MRTSCFHLFFVFFLSPVFDAELLIKSCFKMEHRRQFSLSFKFGEQWLCETCIRVAGGFTNLSVCLVPSCRGSGRLRTADCKRRERLRRRRRQTHTFSPTHTNALGNLRTEQWNDWCFVRQTQLAVTSRRSNKGSQQCCIYFRDVITQIMGAKNTGNTEFSGNTRVHIVHTVQCGATVRATVCVYVCEIGLCTAQRQAAEDQRVLLKCREERY